MYVEPLVIASQFSDVLGFYYLHLFGEASVDVFSSSGSFLDGVLSADEPVRAFFIFVAVSSISIVSFGLSDSILLSLLLSGPLTCCSDFVEIL